MKSILRFFLVMVLVFGATLVWRSEPKALLGASQGNKNQNPHEEVERALRPLRGAPLVAVWSKPVFQSRLEDAFRRNDPCAAVAVWGEPSSVSPETRIAAGMDVLLSRQREQHPLLEELFSEGSPWLGKPQEASRRLETRFLNALLYSNQLNGYEFNAENPQRNAHRNNERAIEIFRELAQEDSENGAYSFFLAQALRQSGAKKEEVEAAYAQAAKGPRFETFYQAFLDTLQSVAYENLATFAWVYSYLKSAPIPDFQSGSRNLRNWASGNDTGKWVAGRIANRLIDTGNRYKAQSPGYEYSQIEYILGYGLRYAVTGRAEKDREEYMERMQEVRNFIGEAPESAKHAQLELYRQMFGKSQDCNFSTWQALYDAYRAKRAPAAS